MLLIYQRALRLSRGEGGPAVRPPSPVRQCQGRSARLEAGGVPLMVALLGREVATRLVQPALGGGL